MVIPKINNFNILRLSHIKYTTYKTKSQCNLMFIFIQKASHPKNDLLFVGGEGPTIPKSKFYFTIPVTIEMVLYRSMQIEDLLFENKIFW